MSNSFGIYDIEESTADYMSRIKEKIKVMEEGEKPEFRMGLLEGSEYEILDRMLALVDDSIDKREGEIIYDALMPIAFELWTQKNIFVQVLYQSFAIKANDFFLDLIAFDHGLERQQAIPSKVVLKFTGKEGVEIPKGTRVGSLEHNFVFVTTEDVVIGSNKEASARAECTEGGDVTNVKRYSLTILLDPIYFVETVINDGLAYDGQDEENDESLRYRILHKIRDTSNGGTLADFEAWAFTITGVTYARVLDKYRGIGTVDLLIGGDSDILERLVREVQALLNKRKLWGLDVLVRPVEKYRIDISVEVSGLTKLDSERIISEYGEFLGVGGLYVRSILSSWFISKGASDVNITLPIESKVKIPDDSVADFNPTITVV